MSFEEHFVANLLFVVKLIPSKFSEMSAANIQGVQWVPGMPDCIVNWSTDLKLYKITVGPREFKPSSSDIVADYIVNCPALKSELKSRITGKFD